MVREVMCGVDACEARTRGRDSMRLSIPQALPVMAGAVRILIGPSDVVHRDEEVFERRQLPVDCSMKTDLIRNKAA